MTSNGASGCVVAGVALDTGADGRSHGRRPRDLPLLGVGPGRSARATGIPAPRATGISLATLAGMEGALILCRAEGSVQPLDDIAEELLHLLP